MPNRRKKGKGKNAPLPSVSRSSESGEREIMENISSASTSQSQPSEGEIMENISSASTSQSQPSEALLTPTYTGSNISTSLSRVEISAEENILETGKLKEQHSLTEDTTEIECERDIEIEFSDRMVLTRDLPPKQPPGKLGKGVKLISNLYPIEISCGYIYHYDVQIVNVKRSEATNLSSLSVDKSVNRYRCLSTKINRKIIAKWFQTDANISNSFTVYDGQKNVYAPKPLNLKFPYEKRVEIAEENSAVPVREEDIFKVIMKPVSKKDENGTKRNSCAINIEPLIQLLSGGNKNVKSHDIKEIQEDVMALETIFRHSPALKFIPIGRSFFHPDLGNMHPLGGGVEIWFGYHQSIRLGQWSPLINLNTTATTFFANTNLLEYFCGSMETNLNGLQQLSLTTHKLKKKLKKLSKDLKGIKIMVNHQKNRRKYTIIEIINLGANRLEFDIEENGVTRKTTVQEYFRSTYNKKLNYPYLPCIRVKPERKKIYFPIECCIIAENQHCKKELEKKEKTEMIKYTAQPPQVRFQKISTVRTKHADYENDEYLNSFGIKVSAEPLHVTGRMLVAPSIMYHGNNKIQPKDGSWNIIGKKFVDSVKIVSWYLLSLATSRKCQMKDLRNFVYQLQNISKSAGIDINDPKDIKIIDEDYKAKKNVVFKKIDEIFKDIKNKKYELVVVVIPDKDKELYRKIKSTAEIETGIMTQCVAHDTVNKTDKSTLSNLCQKINVKKGGINHMLCKWEIPKRMAEPTIIIGADVSHAPVTDKSGISVAAVAGSLDMFMSRFAVSCKLQKNKDEKKNSLEKIVELQAMVKNLLLAFYRHTNRQKPRKIIFYRDGVSDGQFSKIKNDEVTAIRSACVELQEDYKPAITFAVVQKRHHVRIMPEDSRDGAGRERNVKPGTVVDTDIVHPIYRDFFLCSHLGLKGTSKPGHYTILHDDSDFSPDEFQVFTNYLCYTFSRCTKSISHPVPVRYADLAAYRTRIHLAQVSEDEHQDILEITDELLEKVDIDDDIKKTMYFV